MNHRVDTWIVFSEICPCQAPEEEFKPGNSTSDQHTQPILNLYCIWWHRNNHVEHSSNKPFSVSRSKLLVVCGLWYINRKENKDLPLRNGTTIVHQPSCLTLTTAQVLFVLVQKHTFVLNVSERAEYRKVGLFYWIKKVNESWKLFFLIKNIVYQVSVEWGLSWELHTTWTRRAQEAIVQQMETNAISASWSATLILIEYENFWLMSKNLMVAQMIGKWKSVSCSVMSDSLRPHWL